MSVFIVYAIMRTYVHNIIICVLHIKQGPPHSAMVGKRAVKYLSRRIFGFNTVILILCVRVYVYICIYIFFNR